MSLARLIRTPIVLFFLSVTALCSLILYLWLFKETSFMPCVFEHSSAETHVSTPVKLSDILFPIPSSVADSDADSKSWNMANQRQLNSFFRCIETFNCAPNQDKVVILGDKFFRESLQGSVGGEHIWAGSTIEALRRLNYTYLFGLNNEHIAQIYLMIPNNVVAIFMDHDRSASCKKTFDCILSESNPGGIPRWKIFTFSFWLLPESGLERQWVLSPEDYEREGHKEAHTYLGYSIEPPCRAQPYIPPSDREHQAYILAKLLKFFGPSAAWPHDVFDEVSNMTGIRFAMGVGSEPQPNETLQLPTNRINYGLLERPQFMANVARSKILIGMGDPINSPTPYEALCLGVPFLNPISQWDPQNPSDKMRWFAQHNLLKFLDPPYVYNVFTDDHEGFKNAIQSAVQNPIESFIPEPMQMASLVTRLDKILKTDWESKAAELSLEPIASGEASTFIF